MSDEQPTTPEPTTPEPTEPTVIPAPDPPAPEPPAPEPPPMNFGEQWAERHLPPLHTPGQIDPAPEETDG